LGVEFQEHTRKIQLVIVGEHKTPKSAFTRVLSLICVFLVMLVALAQANHVHPQNSKLANHSCSICSVAHGGLLVKGVYRLVPRFAPSMFVGCAEESSKSFLVIASLYIRPPPSV